MIAIRPFTIVTRYGKSFPFQCYDQPYLGYPLGLEVSSSIRGSRPDLIASIFLALILIGVPVNVLSNRLYENSWTIGEWLISYSGGFVRRGLPGTAIYNLVNLSGLSPTLLIWIASLLLYIILAWLLASFCRGKLEASLLLSPMILLGPVVSNNLVRKDILMLVAYGLCLHIIRNQRRSDLGMGLMAAMLINLLSSIAILSHELYGFWALPSLIAILSLSPPRNQITASSCLRGLTVLSPAILVLLACLYFRGSPLQARLIHESWQHLSPTVRSLGTLWDSSPPDGAIQAIGWSTSKAFALPLAALREVSSGLWVPAVWMLTIYLCINFFIGRGDRSTKSFKRFVVLSQFIAIAPLFIVGYDFGRWIFIWVTSSALLYGFLSAGPNHAWVPAEEARRSSAVTSRLFPGIDRRGYCNIILIFLGIPRCCWTVAQFWHCTPIAYLSVLIKDLKIFYSLGFSAVFTP